MNIEGDRLQEEPLGQLIEVRQAVPVHQGQQESPVLFAVDFLPGGEGAGHLHLVLPGRQLFEVYHHRPGHYGLELLEALKREAQRFPGIERRQLLFGLGHAALEAPQLDVIAFQLTVEAFQVDLFLRRHEFPVVKVDLAGEEPGHEAALLLLEPLE